MLARLTLLLAFCCFAVAPVYQAVAQEDDPAAEARAKDFYAKGKLAFQLGHFEEAIDWFEKAYEEVQYLEFLLNIAQSYKQMHRCDKAIFHFKQYIRESEQREELIDKEGVQKLISACEEELKSNPPTTNPDTQPTTEPVEPTVVPFSLFGKLFLHARAALAAGSVGSVDTGGVNVVGPGLAVGAGGAFPVSDSFLIGGEAVLDVRLAGVKAVGNPENTLEKKGDLRGSAGALAAYKLSDSLSLLGGAGVAFAVDGAGPISGQASAGAIFGPELPGGMRLGARLGYSVGGVSGIVSDILGCEEALCVAHQIDLSFGIWLPVLRGKGTP